jgi:hypothetical protein
VQNKFPLSVFSETGARGLGSNQLSTTNKSKTAMKKAIPVLTALASLTMANLAHADAGYAGEEDGRPSNGANLHKSYPGFHKENVHQNKDGSWSFRWVKDRQ